ncbi:transcriptional initiation protein Tat [Acidiphilium acidophilum]|uniref:thiosulfate dehydrogenase n=1 Tax=Acidiphilium acidophilum TaxID=76588 RepID=UPI002E8E6AD6|nr:transcriptional initiation protein Tat [Acidiphilium acidophilum]
MTETPDRSVANDSQVAASGITRRSAVALPAAGLGLAAIGALAPIAKAKAATPGKDLLIPNNAPTLRALTMELAKAPRRRDFKSLPMILTSPAEWDSEALHLLFAYKGGPKQVWDNTALDSPWLNGMRNSINAQIWGWKHPDFLMVSATHGSAHMALYDDYIWDKYLAKFSGGKHSANTWIKQPPASKASAADYNDSKGVFSPHDNSITVLQRRGAVFCACHNEVWELTMGMRKKGINPDKLSHEKMAAEFTNHLIPGVVLTPGVVGTIPEFQVAGYQYIK